MNAGKVLELASVEEISEHPQDPYTKKLLGAVPSLLVA